MTLGNETTIIPVQDARDIPNQRFRFKPISQIAELPKDELADVLGLVIEVTEPTPFTT
jgi:hypothetical protein